MSNEIDIDKALEVAPTHAPSGRELSKWERAINSAEARFAAVAGTGSLVTFDREALFAMQHLTKSDFATKIASQNPRSVFLAMTNVAATGLTLNPAYGLAYLVPRDGAIRLDISYKGLLQIATDTGSIKWGRAECVYTNDEFEYNGPAAAPVHKSKPFGDRGEMIGVYSIAKTDDGDILCGVMTIEQLDTVRSKSDAWKRGSEGSRGPWESFPEEMAKKAVLKRDQKTWPRTDKSQKLAQAVEISNEADGGYTFDQGDSHIPPANLLGEDRKQACDEAMEQYEEAVHAIKVAIHKEDWAEMTAVWAMIPMTAQMALNLAPTKGGVFSTHERACIKERQVRFTKPNDDFPLSTDRPSA
jgi:recombination protein RecT